MPLIGASTRVYERSRRAWVRAARAAFTFAAAIPCPITPEIEELSLRACTAVGARLAGVDLIETANGLEIIEVNTGGEFKGLASTTDVDIAGAIVDEAVRTARRLARERKIDVATSFLGAHALPLEFSDRDEYIDFVCSMIPALKQEGLVDAVDAFCEGIAFTPQQTARVFDAAKAAGLPVKLHADQLSNLHGAALAAQYGALSADHLEYTDEEGAAEMAKAGTVAVLLPGAAYMLRENQFPPVDLFRKHQVPIAVATDCNPGTSPITSLLTVMNMAATLFRMTIDEIIAGVTREAARALGKLPDIGTLETGKYCDLAIWEIERPAELVYRIGFNPLAQRIWRGQ